MHNSKCTKGLEAACSGLQRLAAACSGLQRLPERPLRGGYRHPDTPKKRLWRGGRAFLGGSGGA
eukprot:791913-Alexandrium_andersonii.AAC.1